jgi:hypothetical protein
LEGVGVGNGWRGNEVDASRWREEKY